MNNVDESEFSQELNILGHRTGFNFCNRFNKIYKHINYIIIFYNIFTKVYTNIYYFIYLKYSYNFISPPYQVLLIYIEFNS